MELKDMAQDPLSLHRKGKLAGCSLGYGLYFCVSKPSSGRRLDEAETGSRLTNGSCAMSFNCIRVMLKAMAIVLVDVGLPIVRDVLQPVVVPHFDNQPLATRHVYMDDNARSHRARAVTSYLQRKP
jgi:hypothetical protein